MNQIVTRSRFTKHLKKDAIILVLDNGYGSAGFARRLGVNENNVSRWVREFRDRQQDSSGSTGSSEQMQAKLYRLRKKTSACS